MQVVINIEEAIYKECIPYKDTPIISNLANYNSEIIHAVANGTPLPKGHGDLVDRDAIQKAYDYSDMDYSMIDALNDAPTIIEADKGE